LRILVLGGTSFVGRHLVEQALAAGHEVTIFHRGVHGASLFGGTVERIIGDRFGDLSGLRAGRWDVAVDVSAYVPSIVTNAARVLGDRIDRYVFVSTVSVHGAPAIDDARVAECEALGPSSDDVQALRYREAYGGLKTRCEQAAVAILGGRVTIVRPGVVVGPHDPTDRFTYWVRRLAAGGDVLAPLPRDEPIQMIDARDLARWILSTRENGDAVAPPITLGALLDEIGLAAPGARLHWVDAAQLGLKPWRDLPFWTCPVYASPPDLKTTPLATTVADTLSWVRSTPPAELPRGPWTWLDPAREAALLASARG
jgi:2'-hydroxyisoflavone reductase